MKREESERDVVNKASARGQYAHDDGFRIEGEGQGIKYKANGLSHFLLTSETMSWRERTERRQTASSLKTSIGLVPVQS